MKNKLTTRGGETLVEVLAAILVTALSVTALYGMLMAASAMNRRTQTLSDQYASESAAAETRSGTGEAGTLLLEETTEGAVLHPVTDRIPVRYYAAADDALTAFAADR